MKLKLPTPQPKQAEFINDRHKYLAYGGSRGSGKSFAIRERNIVYALTYPKSKQLVIRRTFPELYNNHIRPMAEWLNGFARYNDSRKEFTFPNGSVVMYGYLDSPDRDILRYQGIETDQLYIDEATQFEEESFQKLTACVRGANPYPKQTCITCNPGGIGHEWVSRRWVFRNFKDTENPDDYHFIQAFVKDNKALLAENPDYIHQLEALPTTLRQMWLEGRWDIVAGAFFEEFRNDPAHYDDHLWTHVINPFKIPSHWQIYRAYDHGYAKPFATTYFAVDNDGCAYEFLEWYGCTGEPDVGLRMPTEQIFSHMKELEEQHPLLQGRQIIGVADPAIWQTQTGESVADTAAKCGIFFSKGDNQRIAGWMQVHNRLHFDRNGRPMLYFFNTCKETIRVLPLMQYDEHKKEEMDTTLEDHLPDSIRYFAMSRPMKAIEPYVDDGFDQSPLHTIFKYNREDFKR